MCAIAVMALGGSCQAHRQSPFRRHFLRPPSTKAPSLHRNYPGFIGTTSLSAIPNGPAFLSRAAS